MTTPELQRAVNQLKEIRNAANWAGKFDAATRSVTKQYRYEKIAHPLDDVIQDLEAELLKRERKTRKRNGSAREYRAPYMD